MSYVFDAIFIVGAYLLGSISFGILMSKAFSLPDPRLQGSGNPGATNVLRSGKKAAAVLTLLGDGLKGWLAVWLALHYGQQDWVVCAVALTAFLGHLYPVYYGFRGGKGVATALGVFLAISPWLGLAIVGVWLLVFAIWRYASLASLAAAWLSPLLALYVKANAVYMLTAFLLAILMTWRHRSNVRKLLQGNEAGFGKDKAN